MKTTQKILAVILSFMMLICLAACDNGVEQTGLWENATYTKNETVGDGTKEIKVDIEAEDQTVTLTVKTDKATLGEALYELGIINDPSFFDVCNGMEASWDKDNAYWAFYTGETLINHGVGDEKISGGEHYRLVYSK